jgi:pimeloyl-ACP methyl ester carboxylesterase
MEHASSVTEASASAFVEHRIHQGQGELYARDYAGAGPALVMLHGFPDNLHIFDHLIPHLVGAGRRVVAFDFLGFGASAKSANFTYGFEQQLGDLEAVVERLALDRIVPVAHDAGGPTAVNYALRHPEHTASVCLFNCFYGSAPNLKFPELIELFATAPLKALTREILKAPEIFAWILNFQRRQFQSVISQAQAQHYKDFLGPVIDQNFRQKPSAGPAFARMTSLAYDEVRKNDGRLAELGRLEVPFRLIWGEYDAYLNRDVAQDLASKFRNSSLVFLPSGHWPQIDQSEDVARVMLEE